MNNYHIKIIQLKLLTIAQLKRMIAAKLIHISSQDSIKMENSEKFFKFLKKQHKEQRLSDIQIWEFSSGFLQQFEHTVSDILWELRLHKTDFQSLFIKIKFGEECQKKNKTNLEQIISFQTKKQGQILLNCKDNLLHELRNQIQFFDIKSLLDKSNQILLNLPYAKNFTQNQKQCVKLITKQVCKNYKIVPFHNFTHGFGVFMSFYSLFQLKSMKEFIDDFSLFFCLIACLSHDIQHQGQNTLFEVKTNSQLSNIYGKLSVLEKMHLSKTMSIISANPKTSQLFQSLTADEKIKARKIITRAILATDMAKHYDYLTIISGLKSQNLPNLKVQQRESIVQALVHGCDVQNPSLEYQSYMHWAHLICFQFHQQTSKQKDFNVEITEHMKFNSITYFFKNQLNFANTIVFPLWQSIQKLIPQVQARGYCSRIKKNTVTLSQALRRNSEPIVLHKRFQQYISNRLQN